MNYKLLEISPPYKIVNIKKWGTMVVLKGPWSSHREDNGYDYEDYRGYGEGIRVKITYPMSTKIKI